MIPWHLQPKYNPKGSPPLCVKRSRKKKGRSKGEKKRIDGRVPVEEKSQVEDAVEWLLDPWDVDEELCPSGDVVMVASGSCGIRQSEGPQCNKKTPSTDGAGAREKPELGQVSGLEVGEQPGQGKTLKGLGYSIYQRYYHVFRQGELAGLVEKVPGAVVKEEYYDHENWCVVAMKTEDDA